VIAVGGGTASGKSTIVEEFVKESGAAYLGHDRYYFDVSQPRGHDFDHPDALDTDRLIENLEQLKAGQAAEIPVYDFATHSRTSAVETMHPSDVIVVEGILVLSDARLVSLADKVVFVDAPESVRLARRIQRDVAERGRTKESVMDQYTSTVKPNHDRFVEPTKALADLVLDGTAPISESVLQLRTAIG
jgi:uridine kinase